MADGFEDFPIVGKQPQTVASDPFAAFPLVGAPTAPSESASWLDKAWKKISDTNASLDARLKTDKQGNFGKAPAEVAPWPSQAEADTAKAARGDQSMAAGYLRQMGQGLFGLGDEAEASARAIALGQRYDDAIKEIRAKNKAFQKAEPSASVAGRMAGSTPLMAVPVGGYLANATSLPSMAFRSGVVGSGFAGAQGMGEAEGGLGERIAGGAEAVKHHLSDPVALGLSVGLPTAAYGIGQVANALGSANTGPVSNLVRRNATVDAERIADKLAVPEAAERLGVRVNPPMVMDAPGNIAYRVAMNIPGVGAPARNAIVDTYDTARRAGEDIATALGRADTVPQAGRTLQEGLDTWRSARIAQLEPHELRALGINPDRAAPPQILMSNEARTDAARANALRATEGLPAPLPIHRPIDFRRSATEMAPHELDAIARATHLPFAARSEALYERWWQSVPGVVRRDITAPNTQAAMNDIQGQVANQISGQGRITGGLADRLANPDATFQLGELRSIRTEVGRALSNFGLTDQRLDRTQLRQLYGSLSRDIEIGVQDLANQALLNSRRPVSDPLHVSRQVADQAHASLARLRRADRFFAAGMQRIDDFTAALGANTPEIAMQRLTSAATEGTRGNDALIRGAMKVLTPDQRDTVAGVMLREMWRPKPSASGYVAETGYSPSTFTTNWERMSPAARQAIFGGQHGLPQAIDDFATVSRALREFEATVNTSNSGTHLITALIGSSMVGSVVGLAKMLGLGAAGYAGVYAWNSPQAVQLMTGYLRLRLNLAQRMAQGNGGPAQAANALQSYGQRVLRAAQTATPYAPTAGAIYSDVKRLQLAIEHDRSSSAKP